MSRLVMWIVVGVVLIGGGIWLSKRDAARPQIRIEKVVPTNALAR